MANFKIGRDPLVDICNDYVSNYRKGFWEALDEVENVHDSIRGFQPNYDGKQVILTAPSRHQRYNGDTDKKRYQDAENSITKAGIWNQSFPCFHDLYVAIFWCLLKNQVVKSQCLLVYDIALRIGHHMGLHPNYVYIHDQTRKGAQVLLGMNIPSGCVILPGYAFPSPLNTFPCAEIEDILCIYK